MALRAYVPGVRLERPPRSGRAHPSGFRCFPFTVCACACALRSAARRRDGPGRGRVVGCAVFLRCRLRAQRERRGGREPRGLASPRAVRFISYLPRVFGLFLWIQRIQRIRSISMVLGYAADGNLCFHCTPHWDHATHTLGTLRTTTRRVRRENGKRRAYPNAEVGHAPRRLRSWMRHTAACGVPQPRHVAQCT